MVIQDAFLVAVQEQPAPAVTLMDPFPALEVNDLLVGEMA